MIVRSWRALAKSEKEVAYLTHFRDEVLPHLRQLAGFCGVTLLRKDQAHGVEIIVLTRWASLSAVRAFAGPDRDAAVVADAAQAWFHSYEKIVTHHEVVLDDEI